MSNSHFRLSIPFDPLLVVSQIITIQSLWYSSLGLLILIPGQVMGMPSILSHMFTDSEIRGSFGSVIVLSFLFNALFGSLFLWLVVKRAKPCLDHAVTIHVIHVLVSCLASGRLPTSVSWWLLNIICAGITCISAEFLCLRSEMQDIPLLSKTEP